jgi:hypothetical protein
VLTLVFNTMHRALANTKPNFRHFPVPCSGATGSFSIVLFDLPSKTKTSVFDRESGAGRRIAMLIALIFLRLELFCPS